ncbi:MAG: DMT family transporter [Methylocystaceae bacterium]
MEQVKLVNASRVRGVRAEFYLLLVALVWGTTFVIVKGGLAHIGPFYFNGVRFLLAFLSLAFIFPSFFQSLNRSLVLSGSLVGVFMFIGYTFQTVGLEFTTATNAGFITGLSVVLVPPIYGLMTRTFPGIGSIFGVLLAGGGLYMMSFGTTGSFIPSYGDLLVLICAVGFALQIVMVSKYSPKFRAFPFTMVQILTVGILSFIGGIFFDPVPEKLGQDVIIALLLTAVPATAVAFLVQNAMQKHTTPSRTAIIFTTEPVFAAVFAHLYAGEALTTTVIIGGFLIIAGMLIAELWSAQKG